MCNLYTSFYFQEESQQLLQVKLPYVPVDKCTEIYEEKNYDVSDDMICAGGIDGKDTCTVIYFMTYNTSNENSDRISTLSSLIAILAL